MEFVRTRDAELIRRVLCHPRVWSKVTDDFAPPAADWEPELHDQVWHVAAYDAGELIGMFTAYPENHVCWEIHCSFFPQAWGPRTRRAFGEFADWLMKRTRCRRLVTSIPATNTLAIRFVKACGMQEYGRNPRSVKIGGELVDQVLLGLSEGE